MPYGMSIQRSVSQEALFFFASQDKPLFSLPEPSFECAMDSAAKRLPQAL